MPPCRLTTTVSTCSQDPSPEESTALISRGTRSTIRELRRRYKGELLYRRRSSRMVLRVPLLINAVDSSGEGSWEQVETVVVSLHGGMVRTHQTYPAGVTLDVRRRDDERDRKSTRLNSSH